MQPCNNRSEHKMSSFLVVLQMSRSPGVLQVQGRGLSSASSKMARAWACNPCKQLSKKDYDTYGALWRDAFIRSVPLGAFSGKQYKTVRMAPYSLGAFFEGSATPMAVARSGPVGGLLGGCAGSQGTCDTRTPTILNTSVNHVVC